MPRSRLYRDGILVEEDFPLSEARARAEGSSVAWIDLDDSEGAVLEQLAGDFGLHPLAVEDALEEHQRAKLDRYDGHLFLTVYAIAVPEDPAAELQRQELDVFVTRNALITVRGQGRFDMSAIVRQWDASPELMARGVPAMVWALLDVIVDSHFDTVQRLDDRSEALEDALFEEHPDTIAVQRRAYRLHKDVVTLRRLALPMREIVSEVLRRREDAEDSELAPYLRDVYDHTLRVADWVDSLRDVVTTIIDTNLASQGNRMNLVMKKVTSWAAIIAVPTLITGFYGMNLAFPFYGTVTGFWLASGLVVVVSGLLYWQFRRRDWL